MNKTKLTWVIETYDSLEKAHEDEAFLWADSWPIEWGRPSEVWEKTERGGTTGLPGHIETSEPVALLIIAAPKMLEALRAIADDEHVSALSKQIARAAVDAATGGRA